MAEVETDSMVLFWGEPTAFSQWTMCEFTIDGVEYTSAEQWMMASKARLFGDLDMEKKILETNSPRKQKAFGRRVKGFEQKEWQENSMDIVVRGNMAKFEQNESLKERLLQTGEKIIVEASPYDKIWGIGLGPNNANALVPEKWKGLNLLGQAIMTVRDRIRAESK